MKLECNVFIGAKLLNQHGYQLADFGGTFSFNGGSKGE
jgi:hypothetical protein